MRIRRPHRHADAFIGNGFNVLPGGDIAHHQPETFGAIVIIGIGELGPVGADGGAGKAEIVLACRQLRFRKDDLVSAAANRPPQPGAILRTWFEAPPIFKAAISDRHAGIILFDAGFQFFENRVGYAGQRRGFRFEIGVFGFHISQHIGIIDLGIALVLQPEIIIRQGFTVPVLDMRAFCRNRRGDGGIGGHAGLAFKNRQGEKQQGKDSTPHGR